MQSSRLVPYLAARRYVSPRGLARPLTPAEADTRRLAYGLKVPTREAIRVAAAELARLIPPRAFLVPIPSSDGTVSVNRRLCLAIARRTCGLYAVALGRRAPVESSCVRAKAGLHRLSPRQHQMIRVRELPAGARPVFLVDNVVTSGNTLRAARAALGGRGIGLVFADASASP